nr:tyrosine-type recombinase/integrase [Sediminibacterium sp. C3]
MNALQKCSDLMALGHYSDSTRINYLKELRFLFQYYSDIRPSEITYEMTVNYLVYLVKTMGCSRVKCKMAAQSFAFFFKHALNKPYSTPAVLFPAHEHKLPAVLSQEEMRSVLNSIINNKHRMLLSLMYSTGIRLMEIARIKITDIESNQMRIKITSGKGKKDRYVLLSPLLLEELRYYFIEYRPEIYLFNGRWQRKKICS